MLKMIPTLCDMGFGNPGLYRGRGDLGPTAFESFRGTFLGLLKSMSRVNQAGAELCQAQQNLALV